MIENDIEKARTLMPALLDRLDREWRMWKRGEGSDRPMFDKYLLPDDPGELPRSKGIRVRVKRWGEPAPLGYWRYEGGKYIFSANHSWGSDSDSNDPHFYAALSEDEAVRWTRSICCTPRADLLPTGSDPVAHHDPVNGLSFLMRDAETGERITIFVRAAVLWSLGDDDGLHDVTASKSKFKAHRQHIEEAASEKYRAVGVLCELDGHEALWVEPSDLR